MMTASDFYDALAGRYHLLFEDWWSAAQRHGEVIAAALSARGVGSGRVLDATCGTGTQALPLAAAGYSVVGTDVSREAVGRAGTEAALRHLEVDLMVRDVRELDAEAIGVFDAVISCDNALPHLLNDEDLARALANLWHCLRPSGVLLVSIRDYDTLREQRPEGVPVSVHGVPGSRHAVGQSWHWSSDAEYVDFELFTFSRRVPAAGGANRCPPATERCGGRPCRTPYLQQGSGSSSG
ncbi:class I SAM-dependent methyltransferase [Nocardioides pinisoli]|uniref:Class I SAM-dependent methyltransferase n=1 Tax=Nocardioides pinisoli TaxID=2950279 RepID=A0ABT1L334_9ACTN|nr:class I SAM-dependent methyltransferase [Nocardioides pinisoli]MCP3424445.1 class I SAM-dependent methyltransferase [Nocardioides pinisoli]